MGKEANILFNVPVGMPFWVRGEHEPMLVDLFLPIITQLLEGTVYRHRE